jgi:SAM-dependent methyltransferase
MTDRAGVAEYVSDVPYPRNFVPQLAPTMMRLVAALALHPPPPGDDFDYCELGAGRGDTLALLAAASPAARFVGIDIASDHVAFARALAERGGLTNLRLIEGDFEDVALRDATSDFDFIVAHGVLSWVSPAKRAALFAFARAKLKPGGLLFISYNALPGWAVMEPLRRIMLEHAATVGGSTLDRARAAYDFARRLAEAKAGYFASHPTAQKMLDLMEQGGLAYVAHEYFHAHWHPMHFADMDAELRASGLSFAGQMPLYLNVPDLAMPPGMKALAKEAKDRVAFEGLKDFASNELFRSDVYVRDDAHEDAASVRRFFETTPFGALTVAHHFKRTVKLPSYSLDFTDAVYRALIPHLCAGAVTASELARRPDLAGLGAERIGQCTRNLCLGGQVMPMRAGPTSSASALRYELPSAFNRHALEEALLGEGPRALACPASGTGISVSLLESLFLRLLTEEPGDREAWVRRFAAGVTFPLVSGATRVADAEELAGLALRELEGFAAVMGPKLVQLGVLAPR